MIDIEFAEPFHEVCDCCKGTTTRLTRFVRKDGDAYAIYYAMYSDNHPERVVKLAVSLGEWSEDADPVNRTAFALTMRSDESDYLFTVVDADESPWQGIRILGKMLNRDEALNHPWIKDVFHITDHVATDDSEIKSYFEDSLPAVRAIPGARRGVRGSSAPTNSQKRWHVVDSRLKNSG